MERKKKLFQSLNFIILVIMVITTISHSLCFANISSPPDSEMRTTFSNIMDTELGDNVKAFFEEKGLEIDLENGLSTTALGNKITFVPLISKNSHQKSQLLAYIDHETAGRLLVFLELMKNKRGKTTSMKIVFPSGRGLVLNIVPFYIYQIDASKTGFSLQDNDDLENTIIVSDTCEVLGIIATVLVGACVIYPDPILCAISAAMQAVYQFLC